MNTSPAPSAARMIGVRRSSSLAALALCLAALLLHGCASRPQPQSFNSPEEAVQTMVNALRADDLQQLHAIGGGKDQPILSSGDEVADRNDRQQFLAVYDEKHALIDAGDGRKLLIVGNSEFPFPIPIVREGDKWFFDRDAGKEEILNRRIGRNELSAIQVCKAIADAQREYALRDPDNNGVHAYAEKFPSDPGKHNGLFWPVADGENPSPLGELVATATAEGYTRREHGPTPYHGYYYRILRSQGPNAPNGAMDYAVKGKMILGFAVVAYPAEYGNSGIMTFTIGPDGVVYQKDLGKQTTKQALAMKAFDPGEGWKKME